MTTHYDTRHDGDLLARIEAFDIDGDAPAFSFTGRLARENGWSHSFAERVVLEYKRFVYLCMAAGHPCTPSEHVDQAWHLHLTYTRSYWSRLCAEVLPRPLHHGPTRGGDDEKHKFDDWYARTKESYRRLLGAPPPEDIWPSHHTRFGDDLRWERVNTARHWVVPKRPLLIGTGAVAAATLALALVGCSGQPGGPLAPTTRALLLAGLALLWLLLLALGVRSVRRETGIGTKIMSILSLCLLLAAGAIGLPALADRWLMPNLGISQDTNNVLSLIAVSLVVLSALVWSAAHSKSGNGGGGGCGGGFFGWGGGCGGGGGGGCGGGGCGGCGG